MQRGIIHFRDHRMNFTICSTTLAIAAAFLASTANAGTPFNFESATLGPTDFGGGVNIDANQYLAVRFSLLSDTNITQVGGHLAEGSPGGLFVAIVALPSSVGFPAYAPSGIASYALASTVFTGGTPLSSDVSIPLSASLHAGDYALVFGSGAFGAAGYGYMPTNNKESGSPSFINGNYAAADKWVEGSHLGLRFVVHGVSAIPEPATHGLLLSGLAALVLFRRQGRKMPRLIVADGFAR
jgi:hypothetical protein